MIQNVTCGVMDLVGLIIKEECKIANLRDWEIANVRRHIIEELLSKPDD